MLKSVSYTHLPTMDAIGELMHHDDVSLILATGGGAMVRAAYSSGTPAIGAVSYTHLLAGPSPSEVTSGLNACVACIENGVCFHAADDAGQVPYLAHCVSSTGKL